MSSRRGPLHLLAFGLCVACPGGGETTGGATAPGTAAGASESSVGSSAGPGTADAPTTGGTADPSGASSASSASTASTASTTTTGATASTTSVSSEGTTNDVITGVTGETGEPPPLPGEACQGYATRYWDCCKAHCGWQGNVNPATQALQSCDKSDQSLGADYDVASSCQAPAQDSAFTCYSMAPWAVSDTLAYGFAAVPATGDICGRCYQLDFDGTGHYNAQDPGSVALGPKTMIVQATNIGHDVAGRQFDILTPGGGVGLFDACSYQWDVDTSELGATYGGFMTYCQQNVGDDHEQLKQCVLGRCAAVFDEPGLAELAAGCEWYVQWYEAADNPNLHYQEVPCPAALVAISGIDRGPLADIEPCEGGGGQCTQEEMDACDCGWTNGGQNCGQDDGSCCWTACCGR